VSKRALPWLQFYPSDWLADSVAGCGLAAQALWFRMMFIAHSSQRYGYLEADGKPIPDDQIARRTGCATVAEYRNLLAELFAAGVPSRTPQGVIYSRRMVRDQQARDAAAERQRRHRRSSHALVTPMSQGEVRSQISEVREDSKTRAARPAAPADPRFQPFLDFAFQSFESKHGQKPNWGARDFKNLKALLEKNKTLTLTELSRRWNHYGGSTEPFTAKQGDSLAYFCARFDSFINGPITSQPKGATKHAKPSLGDNARITLDAMRAAETKLPS
jgi:hypothetical protein